MSTTQQQHNPDPEVLQYLKTLTQRDERAYAASYAHWRRLDADAALFESSAFGVGLTENRRAAIRGTLDRIFAPAVSYAAEVIADNSGTYCGNGLRFATEAEAERYARDLFSRWSLVSAWRVVPSSDPVNTPAAVGEGK